MKNSMKLLAISLFLVFLLGGCTQTGGQGQTGGPGGTGRVVFTLTDNAANISSITSVKVTVDSVMAHSNTEGWITVSSTPKTYDLLELKNSNNNVVLADVMLNAGSYDQVRLDISKVVVTDASGYNEAKLPSGEFKVVGNFKVDANSTTAVTFDFLLDKSLHMTGDGLYILAPVVRVMSKGDVEITSKGENEVEIRGGRSDEDKEVGMDERGNVGVGIKIDIDDDVEIDESGDIKVGIEARSIRGNRTGRIIVGISDESANFSSVSSVKITVDSVMVHSATEGWVAVSSTPKTYDLLQLEASGTTAVLADAQLKQGTYQQIRLNISKVVVTDASGDHEAKLPSGELKIVGPMEVNASGTTAVTLDFMVNDSLHLTGRGEYVMAPVIKVVSTESATVEVDGNRSMKVKKGIVKVNVTVGMDENGTLSINIRIPADATLIIEGNMVKVTNRGRSSGSSSDSSSNSGANASVNVSVNYGY